MSSTVALDILIGLAVLALLLVRQLRTRPIAAENRQRIVLILGVIGIVEIVEFVQKTSVHDVAWVLLALSLASGAVFGALRARQMHVWMAAEGPMRKGNALTLVLWIVGLGLHLAIDNGGGAIYGVPSGFGSASILLYLGVTLGVQQLVLAQRAQQLGGSAPVRPAY